MSTELTHALYSGSRARRIALVVAACLAACFAAAISLSWSAGPEQASPEALAKEREVQKEVRAIGSMLHAPCCPNLTVSGHNSPTTIKMKREIAEMVRAGMGRSEIIAKLKVEYGDVIAPSIIPALWKPYLLIGGPILGLGLLFLLGRWILAHERAPIALHMQDSADERPGKGTKAA